MFHNGLWQRVLSVGKPATNRVVADMDEFRRNIALNGA